MGRIWETESFPCCAEAGESSCDLKKKKPFKNKAWPSKIRSDPQINQSIKAGQVWIIHKYPAANTSDESWHLKEQLELVFDFDIID